MISICIPIYNNDVTALVTELYVQCEFLRCTYEIILIDDASDLKFQIINRKLSEFDNVHYEELKSNISRSAIRNLFPQRAAYPYLLFIDNDAQLSSSDYISRYLKLCSPGIISYGGCKYQPCNSAEHLLRWTFGKEREAISIQNRLKQPGRYFSSFNFLIDKRIILLHPFDEEIQGYGYEDVVFVTKITEQGYPINQTDNPLIHIGLISNEDFLERIQVSLKNLYSLQRLHQKDLNLAKTVKLLQTKDMIDKLKLQSLVSTLFRVLESRFIKNLLGKKPSLFILDLYKLGYLCNYSQKQV